MRRPPLRIIVLAVLLSSGGALASGGNAALASGGGAALASGGSAVARDVAANPGPQQPQAGSTDAGSYRPPVVDGLHVLRGFSPPATQYGPGHLGVDLAAAAGTAVLAAGAGVVRFAGQVAGRGLVVIAHPDGISTEYEPLLVQTGVGARVSAGQPIGRIAGLHRGCPATGCLHWGARRDGHYLDPLSLLRPLGVVRLLPWNWVPP